MNNQYLLINTYLFMREETKVTLQIQDYNKIAIKMEYKISIS